MNLLFVLALQASSPTLCAPPPKLGEAALVLQSGDNFWVYEARKGRDARMLVRIACSSDNRSLSDILNEDDRVLGRGATDLREDRRLPERSGCYGSIGYVERNSQGGLDAVVYGRSGAVVVTLRVTTSSRDDRAMLVEVVEKFRTSLLGCSETLGQ